MRDNQNDQVIARLKPGVCSPPSAVICGIDPQQPVKDVRTMQAVVDQTLTSQRFSAADPLTLAAVSGTLAIVALLASVIPACRASKLDPLLALRRQ